MNKELKFIEIIKNSLKDSSFLGDDCAYLKDFGLCVSADSLIEGVHFDFNFISPYLLAKKALKVNISDILASGAEPKYATVCLSGKLDEVFVKEFYRGLNDCVCDYANDFDLKIIGGDLTGGEKLCISVCIFGATTGRNVSSRKNAKVGYILALCGNFGASARGLKELLINPKAFSDSTKAHLEPKLYPSVSKTIATNAKKPYAMTDSSDGLINALNWLSRASGVGFELEFNKIPTLSDLSSDEILYGGEDYGLVCAMDEEDFRAVSSVCSDLTAVGRVIAGDKIIIDGKEEKSDNNKEFRHFD